MIQSTNMSNQKATNNLSVGNEHAERISKISAQSPATLDRETGINLFRDMTLGRRFEDKCAEMY